ncbi:MAG: NAD(P)H-dependent oxidoreductase [Candidatus Latescibacterota bacterium]
MKRWRDWIMFRIVLLVIAPILVSGNSAWSQENVKKPDVLIIYSSGNVRTPGKTDAVTTPTPAGENMKTISEKLGKALSRRRLSVRLASVSENVKPEEILASRILVLASPSYWSSVSWQMKKYIDEQLTRFYSMPGKMKQHKTAAICMGTLEPNAMKTVDAIFDIVTILEGSYGPHTIVLIKHTPEETRKRIDSFADKIAATLKEPVR